jgi:protein SCO1
VRKIFFHHRDTETQRKNKKCLSLCLCVSVVILLSGCIRPAPLPVLGEVPEFQLTSETGQEFDSHALDGRVWVADFFYTTCDGPCPMMSSKMHLIQTQTAETPDVRLVSFTVDPAHDTPPVLAEYAKHFKQDPARWTFLTGQQASLNEIALHGFKLNGVDGSLGHSTRFTLVDRHRRIRGYYISGEDGFMPKLMHDIRQLEADRS